MNIFGLSDFEEDIEIPEPDLNPDRVAEMILDIRRNDRNRRVALMAPLVLAVAVLGTMFVAPARYGGLDWVPEAGAVDEELPRVFGSNGIWRSASVISEVSQTGLEKANRTRSYKNPEALSFELSLVTREQRNSIPVSASSPPALILGQVAQDVVAEPGQPRPLPIVLLKPAAPSKPSVDRSALIGSLTQAQRSQPAAEETPAETQTEASEQTQTQTQAQPQTSDQTLELHSGVNEPVISEPLEVLPQLEPTAQHELKISPDDSQESTLTTNSSNDENTSVPLHPEPKLGVDNNVEAPDEMTPSTSQTEPQQLEPTPTAMAVVTSSEVVVRSAHVSVFVDVVAEEHSVIDWCATWVDWGAGPTAQVPGSDGDATCTATCEQVATPSGASGSGLDLRLEFTHEYPSAVDVAPVVHIATGPTCSTISHSSIQLSNFSVYPY